ncbi:MAG: carbon-nitrogen hydrolase family protein [Polyangiales bacterium]
MEPSPAPRVAALELPHRFGDVPAALAATDALLARAVAGGLDLALLPECALTGYLSPAGDFDLAPFAEALDGPTARALADLARRHRVALAGPLVERDGDRVFNALLLFDAAGERVGHWRKRHPWYPERWATPGDLGTPVVTLGALRVTACVCFDIHFIADDAPDALAAADALLFPSAWVEERAGDDAREQLLGGLARRFGLAVVNANWGRGEPRVAGQGGSRIVGPEGRAARASGGFVKAAVAPRRR